MSHNDGQNIELHKVIPKDQERKIVHQILFAIWPQSLQFHMRQPIIANVCYAI